MGVDVVARRNVLGRIANHLIVLADHLSLGDGGDCDLVAARDQPSGLCAFHGMACLQGPDRRDHIVGGIETDGIGHWRAPSHSDGATLGIGGRDCNGSRIDALIPALTQNYPGMGHAQACNSPLSRGQHPKSYTGTFGGL